MEFTVREVISISTMTLLLTLIVSHIFIYFGRRGKERLYYIYFCLFALSFFADIIVGSGLQRFIFPSEKARQLISPGVTGLCYFFMVYFAHLMFKRTFALPASKNKFLLPYYISFSNYGVLLATSFFLDYNTYLVVIFPFVATFASIGTLYMLIYFTVYSFKANKIKNNLAGKLTLCGFFIFVSDFFMEEILELFGIHYIFRDTYVISGASVLFWAFALAARFNKEHLELYSLKKSLEEKVKERTLQIQLVNEQKENTFINLAHETRTPLTLIKNSLDDYYQKHDDNIEIDKIKYNIEKINQLIENILNIEKFEKGHEVYVHDKVINVSKFISKVINHFSAYASKKKIKLINNIQENIYLKIAQDALGSLIDNLLINAIKFTDNGIVTVSLFSEQSNVIFSVKDTGVGIHSNIKDKIFEPYFHFSNASDTGFGMGLAIVKNIVDSLQGTIKCNSQPGEGTEFIVSLKRHQKTNGDIIHETIQKSPLLIEPVIDIFNAISDKFKPYILIIEDNPELLIYLRDKLKDDFNIYVSTSCQKALPKISEYEIKPDLIIADIMMENMDGIQFLECLRKTDFSFIPLIFVTAKTSPVDREKALSLGAIDFITKPFEISEVKQKVQSIIDNSKKQQNRALNSVKSILETQSETILKMATNQRTSFDSICEIYNISEREKDIIKLAREGKSYTEIANNLNISQKTVDNHFQNIFRKTGVKKQKDLVDKFHI
jgi:signal transduction histidine kinase/DNA-binding NarL/FixJ family response regulator